MNIGRYLLLALLIPLAGAQAQSPPSPAPAPPAKPAGAGAGSKLREWQNTGGKSLKGRMLFSDAQSVTLKLETTAKPVKVPLASLSDADRIFVLETGWKMPRPWNKWPTDIKLGLGDVDVALVSSAPGKFVYNTRHFEFVAGEALGQTPSKDIARMFEATYELMEASPWGVLAKPKTGRFRAEFYPSREAYIAAGGPQESAGVYIPSKKVFMVPFQSLGLESTSNGWQRSKDYSTQTLIHELTHMLMDDALAAMPIWLAEGTAEYMERMPMKIGTFTPGSHLAAVQEYSKQQASFDLAKTIVMDRDTWHNGGYAVAPATAADRRFGPRGGTTIVPPGGDGGFNGTHQNIIRLYEAGLLLTYYFIHLDGNGDAARLQRFIAACVKNSERLNLYSIRAEEYNKEFEAFTKLPGVKNVGGGRYQYPKSVIPPVEPPSPFEGKPEDFPIQDLELLLDGRSVEEVIQQAKAALTKAGIQHTP